MLNRKLGRKAIIKDSRTLRLANYLVEALPPPPVSCDWTNGVTEWGMMANDRLGCCTIAACGHGLQTWSANAATEITVTDDDVLSYYEQWDGYNPQDPSSDNGGIEINVLTNWRNSGFANHKLIGFMSANVKNQTEIKTAISMFGGVYIGVSLPMAAQSQIVWDISTGDAAIPGSWGGHAVFAVAYDDKTVTCITWGMLKKMTWAFWNTYCDEAYALLGQDWFNTTGVAPSGLKSDQLLADLALIR